MPNSKPNAGWANSFWPNQELTPSLDVDISHFADFFAGAAAVRSLIRIHQVTLNCGTPFVYVSSKNLPSDR